VEAVDVILWALAVYAVVIAGSVLLTALWLAGVTLYGIVSWLAKPRRKGAPS
jgi:hypothetical protein